MPDGKAILDFIIGEIPFYLVMALLIYFFWISPRRKSKRAIKELKENIFIDDKVIDINGMTGKVKTIREQEIDIASGSYGNKYTVLKVNLYANISAQKRAQEAYEKLSFFEKIKASL